MTACRLRRMGELLAQMEKAKGAKGNQHTGKTVNRSNNATGPRTLRQLGLTKDESSRAQQLAAVPLDTFEAGLAEEKRRSIKMRLTRMISYDNRDNR